MTEIIFINHPWTDCKSFHDAIIKIDSNDVQWLPDCSVCDVLACMNRGGNFIPVITLGEFDEDITKLLTHIMAHEIPHIIRFPADHIKFNTLGNKPNFVQYPTSDEDAEAALAFCIDKILKNEPVVLPIEIIQIIQTLKTTLNSKKMRSKDEEWRLELKSDISSIFHDDIGSWSYMDNRDECFCWESLDDLLIELDGSGIIKVHQSEAVCVEKIQRIYNKDGYKLLMNNSRIAKISRPYVEYAVPVIIASLEARGLEINIRWRERKE